MRNFLGVDVYIQLKISEDIVIVPQCWGGVIVTLDGSPQIVKHLPVGISPNRRVNEINTGGNNKTYDYYLDCGSATKNMVETAISDFKRRYEAACESEELSMLFSSGKIISLLREALADVKKACSHLNLYSSKAAAAAVSSSPAELPPPKRRHK
jgi:hypothetical protein